MYANVCFLFAVMKSALSLAEKRLSARQLIYKSSPGQYVPPAPENRISSQARNHWRQLLERVEHEDSRFKEAVSATCWPTAMNHPSLAPASNNTTTVSAAASAANHNTTTLRAAASAFAGSAANAASASATSISSAVGAAANKLTAPSLEICKQRLANILDDDWVALSRLAQREVDELEHDRGYQSSQGPKPIGALLSKKKR